MAGRFIPRDYYEPLGLSTKEFVQEMKKTFPKFSSTANSLCNHPEQTGVTLTNKARSVFKAPREEKRIKSHRYTVRLCDADAERFEAFLSVYGKTAQSAIEAIILARLEVFENV